MLRVPIPVKEAPKGIQLLSIDGIKDSFSFTKRLSVEIGERRSLRKIKGNKALYWHHFIWGGKITFILGFIYATFYQRIFSRQGPKE